MAGTFKLRSGSGRQRSSRQEVTQITTSLADDIGSLRGRLSSLARRQFLEKCWDFRLNDSEWATAKDKFDSYFYSYEECCQVERPYVLTSCSHDELCQSVRHLSVGTRADVEGNLTKLFGRVASTPSDNKAIVDFIGIAILRIDLTSWRHEETLRAFIDRTLGTVSTQSDRDRLPPSFNAAFFDKKVGVRVLWERELTSHLEIAFGDTTLKVFHDVALLDLLEQGIFKDILPRQFIQETRRTVDLLLPASDPQCRHWLKQQCRRTRLGLSVESRAFRGIVDRNLHTFHFWRDQLIVAKDVFDTNQPRGLKQLIFDVRNKVQYWTFWIAFIVFWLTLGSFIATCLQTYKAYYPSPQPS